MLKIKNKFIIFIISTIVLIITAGVFKSFYEKNINRDSYVVLLKGQATLNNSLLKIDDKQKLTIGDTVRTIGKNALAVLEWGDGSVTRLGGDSSVKIKDLYVSGDVSKINIGFDLLSGKSWSNIISFLGEGSYFKEYFRDSEAAVRGTIFSLDLNNDYLNVTDHKVTLNSNGKTVVIDKERPFNIKTFDFIALEEFIKNLKDDAWETINSKIDEEFFVGLKTQLNNDIGKLTKFKDLDISAIVSNQEKKEELYNKLLEDYQKLNFVKSEDTELFKTKLELKNTLVKLADSENKGILVNSTLYDFKDIISKKEYSNIGLVTSMLSDNKELIGNIDFKEYFKSDLIPEELKNILKDDLNNMKNIFGDSFIDWTNTNINLGGITNKGNAIIHNALDNGLEKIDNLINK